MGNVIRLSNKKDSEHGAIARKGELTRAAILDAALELSAIHELTNGCIYISGAVEFDDRPGAVRDQLVQSVDMWRQALLKAIKISIAEGHLKKDANPEAMLFGIYSAVLGLHHDARFLRLTKSIPLAKNLVKKIINENKI